jgi:hypothetical protein
LKNDEVVTLKIRRGDKWNICRLDYKWLEFEINLLFDAQKTGGFDNLYPRGYRVIFKISFYGLHTFNH